MSKNKVVAVLASTLALSSFVLPAYVLNKNAEGVKNNVKGSLSTSQEEALPINAVKRGVFINSGSRDAGADPNWKDGRYIGRKNNPTSLPSNQHH
ncbi:hypothetical protein TL16_g00984 [Triparma laevis f. inornata]|uniref:Uncharacterized protein n=2 Tax=Triparma laevis TaxID=1534972 RepID=A0A9W7A8U0_9STRA|nr:hypothetical protein TL16_g00984 [Triparma laevis f. inornata]GMH64733.1 hypothetical protein TrLO_g1038 [Triparma laevis f. longispina]